MGRYSARLKMLAEAQAGTEKIKKVPTQFAMDAKELDQGRGSDYWTPPHEMAARAFQGFVEDKVQENGGYSPFLNFGPESAAILTPWGWKRPFPNGKERKAINKAFQHLVDILKTKETEQGTALYSRADDIEFTHDVLNEITDHDELFRYPVSQKTTLQGVFNDVLGNDVKYIGEVTSADERQESTADHKYQFQTAKGKDFYVYARDTGEVWIDVSRLEEGEYGSGIFAAFGNYAFNANKIIIRDPEGLSEAAIVRATSAMLSLALRYDTTRFFEPASEQLQGIPEKGIAPLKWQGDDVAKTRALIDIFLQTTQNQFKGIEGYKYDFDKRRFIDRSGRSIGADRFEAIDAGSSPAARKAKAGSATTRRYIFLQSLISSESSQRPELLENIRYWGRALAKSPELQKLFSKSATPRNTLTTADARKILVDHC